MKIQVFSVSKRVGRKRPWTVRWRVDGWDRSRSFEKRVAADKFRRRLELAVEDGVVFDVDTGLPAEPKSEVSFVEYAQTWLLARWPDLANTTRRDYAEALARAAEVFDPSLDRAALISDCFVPGGVVPTTAVAVSDIGLKEVELWHSTVRRRDDCLLYTSPSPRDRQKSRMPSSA